MVIMPSECVDFTPSKARNVETSWRSPYQIGIQRDLESTNQ